MSSAGWAAGEEAAKGSIPVKFVLDRPGVVALVIDDADGRRVRNLVADTWFEAGEHVIAWDGRDESGGVIEGADNIFRTTGAPVVPGTYRVRGLVHDGIGLKYEFSVYTAGSPPWSVADNTGRWMADHTPPIDALYLPPGGGLPARMMLASFVAEAGDAVIWTDLSGKKLNGVRWVGAHWTGALALARDGGGNAIKDVDAYAVSSWLVTAGKDATTSQPIQKVELRVTAMKGATGESVYTNSFDPAPFASQGALEIGQVRASEKRYVSGAAARDGLIVIALVRQNELRLIDARAGKMVRSHPMTDLRGLAFDNEGRLLVLAGKQLRRYDIKRSGQSVTLDSEQILIDAGLDQPNRITVDPRNGQMYISDWGSHTVKVFSRDGKLVRSIGTPGGSAVGKYDPTRMVNPSGMAVAPDGTLWVAEENYAPKRVSLWSGDGKFIKALYGPPQYGGGGNLSADKKTFYYFDNRGMAFDLDWATGDWSLRSIYYNPADDKIGLHVPRQPGKPSQLGINGGPQAPIDLNGHRYLTNAFNGGETSQASLIGIWLEQGDRADPVAVIGDPSEWPLMYEERFASRLPAGIDLGKYHPGRSPALVVWSDTNADGEVQPEEVTSRIVDNFGSRTTGVYRVGRLFLGADLSVTTTFAFQMKPRGFTTVGVPLYDVADAMPQYVKPLNLSFADGHDVVSSDDGFIALTGSPVRGIKDGKIVWTYPNQWPGLHQGHKAPPRQYPGQLIATTKVLGLPATPPTGDGGAIWAYNGDRGNIYLMTTDGFLLADLFQTPTIDQPKAKRWATETAHRGMDVGGYNIPGENFLPTINQTRDGQVYLVTGKEHSSLVHVTGLESIRRLPEISLQVTNVPVVAGGDQPDAARKDDGILRLRRHTDSARVDGKLDEWADAQWVQLDPSTAASAAVAGDQLMLAYRTQDPDLLNNKPESLPMLFKTGGAMDLMLRTDTSANHDNGDVLAGDVRLLVTEVKGKPVAVLYTQLSKGKKQPVPFASPHRTVMFDRVEDVSALVRISHAGGAYEFSIPLKALGLDEVQSGQRLRADIGVLRGAPGQTTQRLYWHNKQTGIVEDVPSEAVLTPDRWGTFIFD